MSSRPPDPDERFREWLSTFRPLLYKVVHSFTRAAQDREELLQDILVQLWQSAARYDGRCAASTWVYRVAFNTALAWNRTARRHRERMEHTPVWEAMAAPCQEPSGAIEELYAAIRQLPRPDAALIMMHLDGLTYREMAEVTGLSETHVGAKLTRARVQLGQLMKGLTV